MIQPNRFLVVLLTAGFLLWQGVTPATRTQTQKPFADAAAPEPTNAVQDLIVKVNQLGDEKKNVEALSALEKLIEFARDKKDKVGEAEGQRGRAIFLERVGRMEEAVAVWKETAELWASLGATPERIEALLRRALILGPAETETIAALLNEAQQLGKSETQRPLGSATELHLAGSDWFKRRAFTQARDLWQTALSIRQRFNPNSLDSAATLNNLGGLAQEQGDWNTAYEFYQRALVIFQGKDKQSLATAAALVNLGNVAQQVGALDDAKKYYFEALTIEQARIPNSLPVSITLNNLGGLEYQNGELNKARDYYERALEIQQKIAAGSLNEGRSLSNLGVIAAEQNRLADANDYFQRALVNFERHAPRSLDSAGLFFNLAVTARKQNRFQAALRFVQSAWDVARDQSAAVAGDERRQAYYATISRYGSLLMQIQLALNKTHDAFLTLEQGRAQTLQQLIGERNTLLSFAGGSLWESLKTALAELQQSEATLNRARTAFENSLLLPERQNSQEVAQANAETAERARQLEQAQAAYVQVRQQADSLWADIQRKAPQIFVPPLTATEARRLLPPGTVFIGFSIDDEQTNVILLHGKRRIVTARVLKIKRDELQRLVSEFRVNASNPRSDEEVLFRKSRDLFQRIFPNDLDRIVLGAKRLLISPDGPLWELPFAALAAPGQRRGEYLGQIKPIVYTQSLALFKQVRDSRPEKKNDVAAIVIGDASDLPSARTEALNIAQLYHVRVPPRDEATEAALRRNIENADIIHLATHGEFNRLSGMSSGIFLTPPQNPATQTNDDGVLQAWEIFSQLKIKAELVVMSACETGRGQVMQGEGIIGLTRSWQYAGARSVLASHWRVADTSTAQLMFAFHKKLLQGVDKDEALRQAIGTLRDTPNTSHPYYWAAFFFVGDWQPLLTVQFQAESSTPAL